MGIDYEGIKAFLDEKRNAMVQDFYKTILSAMIASGQLNYADPMPDLSRAKRMAFFAVEAWEKA